MVNMTKIIQWTCAVAILLSSWTAEVRSSSYVSSAMFGPKALHLKHVARPLEKYTAWREEDCLLYCVADCNCLSVTTSHTATKSQVQCQLESGWTNTKNDMLADSNTNYTYVLHLFQAGRCFCDHFYKQQSCYRFYEDKYFTWNEAKAYCAAVGMSLVSMETMEEYHFIKNIIQIKNPTPRYWTSGRFRGNDVGYEWDPSGAVIHAAMWESGRPGNLNCVGLHYNQLLYDANCGGTLGMICEKAL